MDRCTQCGVADHLAPFGACNGRLDGSPGRAACPFRSAEAWQDYLDCGGPIINPRTVPAPFRHMTPRPIPGTLDHANNEVREAWRRLLQDAYFSVNPEKKDPFTMNSKAVATLIGCAFAAAWLFMLFYVGVLYGKPTHRTESLLLLVVLIIAASVAIVAAVRAWLIAPKAGA